MIGNKVDEMVEYFFSFFLVVFQCRYYPNKIEMKVCIMMKLYTQLLFSTLIFENNNASVIENTFFAHTINLFVRNWYIYVINEVMSTMYMNITS